MELVNYKTFGDKSNPSLMIVHGLFGCLDNWMSLAKIWATSFYVITLDVRNHGKSFHDSDMSFETICSDLINILDKESITKTHLIGHSMGGKIAMEFAANFPERLDKLIIADVAPYEYSPHHNDVFYMLEKVDLHMCESRHDTETQIRRYLDKNSIVQFMSKNITRNEETMKFEWKFNLPILKENYPYLIQRIPQKGFKGSVLFIGGEESKYISHSTSELIPDLYPNYELEFIRDAGHWLHADKPTEFYETVSKFISNN